MSPDNIYYLRQVNIDQGALDFGICNGFVYLIKASGEVLVNRLTSSTEPTFIQHKEYQFEKIFEKKNFIKITNINSFPLDTVSYGNRLFILTEDDITSLNLSFNPNKIYIEHHINCKAISATKKNGLLFFSCRENGFVALRPSKDGYSAEYNKTPSSKILVSGNKVLNLYPETTPKVFKINSYKSITKRELVSSHMGILTEDEESSQFFKEMDIIGRDITAPYSTPDKIIIPTIEDICLSFPTSKKRNTPIIEFRPVNGKNQLVAGCSYEELKPESMNLGNKVVVSKIQDDCIEEQPIAYHYHPRGIVAEYWDSVKFISNSGHTYDIVEGEEVAEVRTYPDNPRYRSLIAIATENSCHLKYIPIENQKEYQNGKK